MNPIIKTFKVTGSNSEVIGQLTLLQKQHPDAKLIVSGYHDAGAFQRLGLGKFKSQLILHIPDRHSVLILGSPYKGTMYYAHGAAGYAIGTTKYPIGEDTQNADIIRFHDQNFDFKGHDKSDFLWVKISTIKSCEIHYMPRSNKEAALNILTRLEQD